MYRSLKTKSKSFKNLLKIECRRKVTKCGFGSNAQSDPGVYGSEVPYHSCCLPYRVGFWVGPLGYSGPFSFWGSFLPIFSHFLNGSGSKNILDMAQTQNQKSKPSSWTFQKCKKNWKILGKFLGSPINVFFLWGSKWPPE